MMSIQQFKDALAAATTWESARAVVAEFEPSFDRLPPASKNICRRAWKERQAELALIGEVKP